MSVGTDLQRWAPQRVPAGWRVEAIEGTWGYPMGEPLVMAIDLRYVTGDDVRVRISSPDEWTWVEETMLPALAALFDAGRDWDASARARYHL